MIASHCDIHIHYSIISTKKKIPLSKFFIEDFENHTKFLISILHFSKEKIVRERGKEKKRKAGGVPVNFYCVTIYFSAQLNVIHTPVNLIDHNFKLKSRDERIRHFLTFAETQNRHNNIQCVSANLFKYFKWIFSAVAAAAADE